jgi:outer membrane immunogenic protein
VARAEYRYADFGTVPFTIARTSTIPAANPTVDNFDVRMRTHTAVFGLAYKFGDPIAAGETGDGWAGALAARRAPTTMSWTGTYAGFGLGARASRTDLTTTSATQGGLLVNLTQAATDMPLDGTAFRAAPYFGVDWQFAPQWVAGLEGDTGFARQTRTLSGFPFSPGVIGGRRAADALSVKTTWDATLRGRLGFLLTPATLAFVTGGAAWQRYEITSVCASTDVCGVFGFTPVTIVNSTIKLGWTVGGGIETMLGGNWLARGEYRYSDFGTAPFSIVRSSPIPAANPTVANFEAKLRTHIVSFGLAYKFN